MLVVTRKVGERIIIGDQVTVTVVRIAGGMVRIGIEAPPAYAIVRRELLEGGPATEPGSTHQAPPQLRSSRRQGSS